MLSEDASLLHCKLGLNQFTAYSKLCLTAAMKASRQMNFELLSEPNFEISCYVESQRIIPMRVLDTLN